MSKIIGNTTTTPVPRSDWSQTDKTKADFIRHKPILGVISQKDIIDKSDLTSEINQKLGMVDTLNNTKLNASELDSAIDTALTEAKASGEFTGEDAIWWKGIPDQIIIQYYGSGVYKSGKNTYHGAIMKGDNILWSEDAHTTGGLVMPTGVSYDTAIDQNGITIDIYDVPSDPLYNYNMSRSTISPDFTIDGVVYTKSIEVIYMYDGVDGDTPQKGVDYFTEADKNELILKIAEVVDGTKVVGYVDDSNNIVIYGDLADGTYSVKYNMGNGSTSNIGNLVVETTAPPVIYNITKNLTNCTINNNVTQVNEGNSYSATITADDGYENLSVTVTMGGTNVSVSNGVINISSVTGDIVITASAKEIVVETKNWIEEVGYTANTRLSLSSGNTTSATDYECTGFIPAKINDVIRVKNIDLTSENSTNIIFYDSSKNPIACNGSQHGTSLAAFFATNEGNGVYKGTIGALSYITFNTAVAYIRIGSKSITADSILTVNEEIV